MSRVVFVFALLCCSVATAFDHLTLEKYDQVTIGTNTEFVHGLLGPPTAVNYRTDKELSLMWQDDDVSFIITFQGDRVVSKAQYGL